MENYGKRITALRKKHNLAQSELGALLNVTPQAVSKWENGLSEPDLGTLRKMCEIFNVTTDEMLGVDPIEDSPKGAQKETVVETKIINGYCESCQKPVSFGEYDVKVGGRSIICKECVEKRHENAKKSLVDYYVEEIEASQKALPRGLIRGGIWGGIFFIFFLFAFFADPTQYGLLIDGTFIAFTVLAFRSQLSWGGAIADILPDNFSFLSVILLPFSLAIRIILAPFFFPFALISKIREPKRLEKEKQKVLNEEESLLSLYLRPLLE